MNMQKYGQADPPVYSISAENSTVPVGVVVGKDDLLIPPEYGAEAYRLFRKNGVLFKQIDGGHFTYFIGKDVSWMTQDILPLIRKYSTPEA